MLTFAQIRMYHLQMYCGFLGQMLNFSHHYANVL